MTPRGRTCSIALLAVTLSCRAPDASPDASSIDAPARTTYAEDAEADLLVTNYFATANWTFGGGPPGNISGFNAILDSPHAAESIERLVASSNPAARLWGACGLHFTAPERYLPELEKLRALEGVLWVQDGCVITQLSFPEIVDMIRKRSLPMELRREFRPDLVHEADLRTGSN